MIHQAHQEILQSARIKEREKLCGDTTKREFYWMRTLRTLHSNNLNIDNWLLVVFLD